jgi:hypothetical protein
MLMVVGLLCLAAKVAAGATRALGLFALVVEASGAATGFMVRAPVVKREVWVASSLPARAACLSVNIINMDYRIFHIVPGGLFVIFRSKYEKIRIESE